MNGHTLLAKLQEDPSAHTFWAHHATQSDGGWQMLAYIPSFASVACEGTGTFPQACPQAPQWARDDFYRQADGEDR